MQSYLKVIWEFSFFRQVSVLINNNILNYLDILNY